MSDIGYILIVLLFIGLTPGIFLKVSQYSPLTNAILHGFIFIVLWELMNSLIWLNIYEGFEEAANGTCYHPEDCLINNYCPHIEVCRCVDGKCKRGPLALCNDDNECASGKCIDMNGENDTTTKRCT
jgi:hypothetical protein